MNKPIKLYNNIRTELAILFFTSILCFILWNTFIVYPIKIFVVFLHETSHASMAIMSGGIVESIDLKFNLGGETITSGGNEFLISSAGYLGSLFFGLMIFYSGHKRNIGKLLIGILLGLCLYILASCNPTNSFIMVGFIVMILIGILTFLYSNQLTSLLLKVIGITSSLYVLFDIHNDLISRDVINSDASIIANQLDISSVAVGFIWLIISSAVIYLFVKKLYFNGRRGVK